MICIPARTKGRVLFAISRDIIAWRTPSHAWMMFKPPWNRPLFSERNGFWDIVWSWRGYRLLREPGTTDRPAPKPIDTQPGETT